MHRNRSSSLAIAILAVLAVLAVLAPTGTGAASAQTAPALGIYTGPINLAGTDDFASRLGKTVPYASDFVDFRQTWDQIANPLWLLDPWSSWVNAAPGRRLSLAVPMLTETSRGQLAQGARGDFDAHFRTLAQNMVSRGLGTSVLRLGWEMNTTALPWSAEPDPVSFRSYWARIVGVMRAVPGAGFSFDWTTNAGIQGRSALTSFDQFYPGDAYVDIVGIDNYDIKWGDGTSTPEQRWNFHLTRPLGLNDHKAFAIAHNKPLSFPEWGLWQSGTQDGGGGDNPYYIDRMADWFNANNTLYQSYFNVDVAGGGQHTLVNYPNAQARYRQRFGPTPPPPPPPTTTTTTTTTTRPPPPPPPPPPPSANLLDADTSGVEGSVGTWASWFNTSVSRSTLQAEAGSASLRVGITAPNGWGATLRNWPGFTAAPGAHIVSFWGKSGSGSNLSVDLKVRWRDASNAIIGTSVVTIPALTTTWQQAAASVMAPPGTVRAWLEFGNRSGTAGDVEYFDEITLNRVRG